MNDLINQVGWASVKNGKWHATHNPEPSWYPRDNQETTLCGLSINPLNVVSAGEGRAYGAVCSKCSNKL